jgi:hypothetical protein
VVLSACLHDLIALTELVSDLWCVVQGATIKLAASSREYKVVKIEKCS